MSRGLGDVYKRQRQRGAVLVAVGRWPGADITLEVADTTWHGLGQGRGRLRRRELAVLAYGRGAAARTRQARLWLPGEPGPAESPAESPAAGQEEPTPGLRLAS